MVERTGLLVGLSAEADRNEVRKAIVELYEMLGGRAKALEAMWRSMHPSFRDRFARHLDDPDLETRRSAVWGVGYYGVRTELEKLRKLFDNEELRSDALFAYALALPGEVSRGRINSMLARVQKDARGLSEMEEDLVKVALDETLMLAGKEPDPVWGDLGKQRSVHNNYFTLPVLFTMISNHYPLTYGHPRGWLVLIALLLLAAYVRHFFNLRHKGRTVWAILVTAAMGGESCHLTRSEAGMASRGRLLRGHDDS